MKKILGLGIATIDYISIVDKYPLPNENIVSKDFSIQGGGDCANTLSALSRLGLNCSIITKLGKDRFGDEIIETLKKENIDTLNVIKQGIESSFSFIISDIQKNNRTIIHKRGASYDDEVDIDENLLDGINLVYLDGRFHKSSLKLAQLAKKNKIKLVVEAESKYHNSYNLFKYADAVITSKKFHKEYFNNFNFEKNLKKILNFGPKIAITTLGEKGSVAKTKEDTIRLNAYKTNIVDTTGAGDAFIAGFIYGFLHDYDLKSSLDFGSRIASIKCEKIGSRKGLPYKKEIKDIIEKTFD